MRNKRFFSVIILLAITAFASLAFRKYIHGRVVCFGDSITYGAKVDGHSWVWFLSKEHPGTEFINAGRSGRRTADKAELIPVLKKYPDADYYLLFLGVNDLKDGTDSMVDNCISNMKWMIAKIRAFDSRAKIVILSPSDINLKSMALINVQKKYNQNTRTSLFKLETKYKDLAKEEHIGFISLLHAVSKPNYADGLHPDLKGQQQIAHLVWKHLKNLY